MIYLHCPVCHWGQDVELFDLYAECPSCRASAAWDTELSESSGAYEIGLAWYDKSGRPVTECATCHALSRACHCRHPDQPEAQP